MTAACQEGISCQQVQASILNVTMGLFSHPEPATASTAAPMCVRGERGACSAHVPAAGRAICAVLLAWALCAPALAAGEDPPGRVGRVSLVAGSPDLLAEPSNDWAAATLNTPVLAGTALRTAAQSRAEARIGSVAVQLNGNSQLSVQTLDDQSLVFVLARGNIALNLRELAAGERVEVRAAEAVFTIAAPGNYHFGFAPLAHRFEARVFVGAGTFGSPTAAAPLSLTTGQQAQVDPRTLAVIAQGDAQRTRFDEWAAQRGQRSERFAASSYVSPEMTGAEELDANGRWRVEPRVGAVWYPSAVDADWAPYRAGRWAWVAPWGWTWIDDAPWGFAPFHYGRWLFLAGRWGWVPGSYVARPAFAPALVGFYGGAGVAAAPWIGWFPLAPGEAYRPGFAASARFTQRVNVGIAAAPAVAAGSYRYAQTSFAATAMSRESFGGAAPLGPAGSTARVPLTPAQLSGASVLAAHGAPAPAPAFMTAAPGAIAAVGSPGAGGGTGAVVAEPRPLAAAAQGAARPDAQRGEAKRARIVERRAAAERAQARRADRASNAGAVKAPKLHKPAAERPKRAHPNRP
jgi:hypothetical protein